MSGNDLTLAECAAASASARAELADLLEEYDDACSLVQRQGDLLRGVAAALRGAPPPDTLWSHHDLPELAATMATDLSVCKAKIAGLEADKQRLQAILDGAYL